MGAHKLEGVTVANAETSIAALRQQIIDQVKILGAGGRPVYGAALGLKIAQAGLRGTHKVLGYPKLTDFVLAQCSDVVGVRQTSKDAVFFLVQSGSRPNDEPTSRSDSPEGAPDGG